MSNQALTAGLNTQRKDGPFTEMGGIRGGCIAQKPASWTFLYSFDSFFFSFFNPCTWLLGISLLILDYVYERQKPLR